MTEAVKEKDDIDLGYFVLNFYFSIGQKGWIFASIHGCDKLKCWLIWILCGKGK